MPVFYDLQKLHKKVNTFSYFLYLTVIHTIHIIQNKPVTCLESTSDKSLMKQAVYLTCPPMGNSSSNCTSVSLFLSSWFNGQEAENKIWRTNIKYFLPSLLHLYVLFYK